MSSRTSSLSILCCKSAMFHSCSQSQSNYSFFFLHHHSQSLKKPTKLQTLNPPQPLAAAAAAARFGFLLQLHTCNRSRNGTLQLQQQQDKWPNILNCIAVPSPSSSTETRARDSKLSNSTAEYLVSSLGLSPESALSITKLKRFHITSTSNADSVLALFRDYGFTQSQIIAIISKSPVLLVLNPHKNLKPKLDFFSRNGISGDALTEMVTVDPHLLKYSLDRKIIPGINFLQSFFPNNEGIYWMLSTKGGTNAIQKFRDTVPPNVRALRSYGVSDSIILNMLRFRSLTLWCDPQEFKEILKGISEMGFDPSKVSFVDGVSVLDIIKKEKWVAKLGLFKKEFGWTDQQVRALFLKLPRVMSISEGKLKEVLGFFMERLEWTPEDIITYVFALTLSLEGRILPRFSVLEILMSKGLVKKSSIGHALLVPEDKFLSMFVDKYQLDIPQLLEIYQQKVSETAS